MKRFFFLGLRESCPGGSRIDDPLLFKRFDFLSKRLYFFFKGAVFSAASVCQDTPHRCTNSKKIAKGIPMQAMMMLFCRSKFFSILSNLSSMLSFLVFIYSFIRFSDALISLLTSSLTIKRILSRSASVSAPSEGNTIVQEQNNIEKSSIVFIGDFHAITQLTLTRWVADPYREIGLVRLPT